MFCFCVRVACSMQMGICRCVSCSTFSLHPGEATVSQMSMDVKASVLACLGAAAAAVCSAVYYKKKQEVQLKKLVKAAGIAHDDAEWTQVYRACLEENKDGDVKTLMRLIYAQTRTINAGASNYMFTRVVETTEFVEPKSGVQENIVQWSRNRERCTHLCLHLPPQ